jgi:tetratricopeptide (TPR) repeat protein
MAELRIEPYEIPAADLGPENPLPVFRGPDENGGQGVDDSVPQEDRRYMGWRTAFRVLPYRMQDNYNRKKKPRAFRAAVLENEYLRATFLPELGGRLVSLVWKPEERELLDRNPVFQPANLALRNAWISGGIEWNAGGVPGHHYLTCSPVFAARATSPGDERVLRIYEWERVKCFPWQIDFHLPPRSPFLFAHVHLINPHDHEIAMYWWTNMAVEEKPGARVLFPADTAIGFCDSGLGLVQLPMVRGRDASYATNVPFAQEMFSRIAETQRRWVTCLDEHGRGLFQTSTDLLRGRKLFCWGMNSGGRRWQEFLSEPGWAYIEIQAGLARTQLECLPMPARTTWAWTEAFGLLEADPAKVHSNNWSEAWHEADAKIEALLPRARIEALHAQFEETAQQAPLEILHRGSGWGALERKRARSHGEPEPITASTPYNEEDLSNEQEPWNSFLDSGVMPESDPAEDPGPPMVQPEWRALLEAALHEGRGDHWRSWHHLGIMRLEAADADGAREAWERSIRLRPSGWALRNLAVLAKRAGDKQAERDYLCRAWETGPKITPLAIEYANVLVAAKDYEALGVLIESLPEDMRGNERIRIISAQAALDRGQFDEVEQLFDHEFATNREGEVTLTDLWFAVHEKRLAAKENLPIDEAFRRRVRKEFPPPRSIDFRMVSEVNE